MVRLSLVVAALASTIATAHADCPVDVMRAPDDVRAAIGEATKRVDRCNALAVRVITTDIGMLYTIAVDPAGKVYEEIDKDRTAVVEHVMSWALAGVVHALPAPNAGAGGSEPIGPALGTEEPATGGPGAMQADRGEGARGAPEPHRGKWLGLSGFAGKSSYGIRGELDFASKGPWSFGLAVGYTDAEYTITVPWASTFYVEDYRFVATVAHTSASGPWSLRAQAGAGLIYTAFTGFDAQAGNVAGESPNATAELAVRGGRLLDDNWAIDAGVLFSVYAQNFRYGGEMHAVSRDYDSVVMATLRRKL